MAGMLYFMCKVKICTTKNYAWNWRINLKKRRNVY